MGLFSPPPTDPRIIERLAAIERKLDAIMASFGITADGSGAPAGDAGMDQVRSLALKGQKIQAIKLHRELTGLGLAESKAYVDSIR